MAQKKNPIGLRLKNRLNWKTAYNFSFNQSSNTLVNSFSLNFFISRLITIFGLNGNNHNLIQDSKGKYNTIKVISNKRLIDNINYNLSTYINQRNHFVKLLSANIFKSLFICWTDQKYFRTNNKKIFQIISPKILGLYITEQLIKPTSTNNNTLSKNLNVGILNIINKIADLTNSNILGLKVSCSGKWKKTRDGKTKKLTFLFGKLRRSTLSNLILYDTSSVTTKFGICTVKVWIHYKTLPKNWVKR